MVTQLRFVHITAYHKTVDKNALRRRRCVIREEFVCAIDLESNEWCLMWESVVECARTRVFIRHTRIQLSRCCELHNDRVAQSTLKRSANGSIAIRCIARPPTHNHWRMQFYMVFFLSQFRNLLKTTKLLILHSHVVRIGRSTHGTGHTYMHIY